MPDTVLKAALLRRAAADIDRIVALRGAKGALESLLARGSVGDDLWQRFQRADAEMKAEIEDVIAEVRLAHAAPGPMRRTLTISPIDHVASVRAVFVAALLTLCSSG